MKDEKTEISFGAGSTTYVKTKKLVFTRNLLILKTEKESFNLDVKIEADFEQIPEEYHEVFLNFFTAKYLDTVSIKDNMFSKNVKVEKNKWWLFWTNILNKLWN